MTQSAFEIIQREVEKDRQRIVANQQGTATFENPSRFKEFDVGGSIFSIDKEGNITDTGRKGSAKENQVIGIEHSGRGFNLGEVSTRAPIQGNVFPKGVSGAGQGTIPFPDLQKSFKDSQGRTIDLQNATEQEKRDFLGKLRFETGKEFFPGGKKEGMEFVPKIENGKVVGFEFKGDVGSLSTIPGIEKLQTFRDAGITDDSRRGGFFNAPQQPPFGSRDTGAPLSIEQLTNLNYSAYLELDEKVPKPREGESGLQFQLRLTTWKLKNLTTAYNDIMRRAELSKIADLKKRNKQAISTIGSKFEDTRSKSQIEQDLKTDYDALFNNAKSFIESEERAAAQLRIDQFKSNIEARASDAATKAIVANFEAEQKKKAEQKIKERVAEIRQKTDKSRRDAAQKIIDARGKLAKTPEELSKESKNEQIESEFNKIKEADPTLSAFEAFDKAKRNVEALLDTDDPDEAEVTKELNDLFSDPSFREKNKGNEIDIAFKKYKDIEKSKTYATDTLLLPESEVNKQVLALKKRKTLISTKKILQKTRKSPP